MPETTDPSASTEQLSAWFDSSLVVLLIIAVILVLVAIFAPRFVHAFVRRALASQAASIEDDEVREEELAKRSTTLEALLNSVIRIVLVVVVAMIFIGLLDIWGVLAGLGLLLAALTLAGQPIVLDYLMGTLIIIEGQYFTGDWITVGSVSGTVESVGLRKTVVRDTSGSVHTISNGEIRIVSNSTRLYATAEVELPGVPDAEVARVIAIMDRVGREMDQDPAWAHMILEAPGYRVISEFTGLGLTMKMRGLVRSADRWSVAAEIRRRLANEFAEAGVALNRLGTPPSAAEPPAPKPKPRTTGSKGPSG